MVDSGKSVEQSAHVLFFHLSFHYHYYLSDYSHKSMGRKLVSLQLITRSLRLVYSTAPVILFRLCRFFS